MTQSDDVDLVSTNISTLDGKKKGEKNVLKLSKWTPKATRKVLSPTRRFYILLDEA